MVAAAAAAVEEVTVRMPNRQGTLARLTEARQAKPLRVLMAAQRKVAI